jgi:hypothetical protein
MRISYASAVAQGPCYVGGLERVVVVVGSGTQSGQDFEGEVPGRDERLGGALSSERVTSGDPPSSTLTSRMRTFDTRRCYRV